MTHSDILILKRYSRICHERFLRLIDPNKPMSVIDNIDNMTPSCWYGRTVAIENIINFRFKRLIKEAMERER